MPRYKPVCYEQDKFIPINFSRQILPGTFEYTLRYLVDEVIDTSVFDEHYVNDETETGKVPEWFIFNHSGSFLWILLSDDCTSDIASCLYSCGYFLLFGMTHLLGYYYPF